MPTSYNIPLGGNPNIQNFEFPQTSPAVIPLNPTPNIQNFEFSQMPLTDISLNPNQNPQNVYEFPQMPPANIGPSLYNEFQPQIPREQVTNIPVENAPEAQYTTLNQLSKFYLIYIYFLFLYLYFVFVFIFCFLICVFHLIENWTVNKKPMFRVMIIIYIILYLLAFISTLICFSFYKLLIYF